MKKISALLCTLVLSFTLLPSAAFADSHDEENFGHEPFISGYTDGTFKPDRYIQREQFAIMLAKSLGLSIEPRDTIYKDVTADDYASGAIASLYEEEIMFGKTSGHFYPSQWIDRAQVAAIVDRWVKMQCEADSDSYGFCDNTYKPSYLDIPFYHWAKKQIESPEAYGIMEGYNDGTFRPEEYIKRDQAAKVLNRLFDREPHVEGLTVPFIDVPEDHWAYDEIAEAAVRH
ncbi:S-layer homology domain-containing protein [Jeotgalibacillus sp. JSM ZJ347]|uniref:S-layer homology domain-containing protein n=1 Tax=Jeotgalibacillus sp. JSM ZJ347 TaxID=3342117 RepID=UPI0035A9546B